MLKHKIARKKGLILVFWCTFCKPFNWVQTLANNMTWYCYWEINWKSAVIRGRILGWKGVSNSTSNIWITTSIQSCSNCLHIIFNISTMCIRQYSIFRIEVPDPYPHLNGWQIRCTSGLSVPYCYIKRLPLQWINGTITNSWSVNIIYLRDSRVSINVKKVYCLRKLASDF